MVKQSRNGASLARRLGFAVRQALRPRRPVLAVVADDCALAALACELHAAARLAQRQLGEMPEHATRAKEAAAIEAILQPGEAIADRMLGLRAVTEEGSEARLRASAWKMGEYIDVYLAHEYAGSSLKPHSCPQACCGDDHRKPARACLRGE